MSVIYPENSFDLFIDGAIYKIDNNSVWHMKSVSEGNIFDEIVDKIEPKTYHSKFSDFGFENRVIAVCLVQAVRFFNSGFGVGTKEHEISCRYALNICRSLLGVEEVLRSISTEVEEIANKIECREVKINNIPQVKNIFVRASLFYVGLNQALNLIAEFLMVITNIKVKQGRFDLFLKNINGIEKYSNIYKRLIKAEDFCKKITDIRNCIEHSDNEKYLFVSNFKPEFLNSIQRPSICVYMDGKRLFEDEDIVGHLNSRLSEALHFFEDLIPAIIVDSTILKLPMKFEWIKGGFREDMPTKIYMNVRLNINGSDPIIIRI